MRKNLNNLEAGQSAALVLNGGNKEQALFLGFTGAEEQYSNFPKFKTLKEVKAKYNVKTLKELEELNNGNKSLKDNGYGFTVYALFAQVDPLSGELYQWAAYLYEGRWSYGSGAGAVRFAE